MRDLYGKLLTVGVGHETPGNRTEIGFRVQHQRDLTMLAVPRSLTLRAVMSPSVATGGPGTATR